MAGRPLRRLRNAADRSMVEVLVAAPRNAWGAVKDAAWDTAIRYNLIGVSFRYTTEGDSPAVGVQFRFDPLQSDMGGSAAAIRDAFEVFLERRLKHKDSTGVFVVGQSLSATRRNPDPYMVEDYRTLGALLKRQSEWNARLRSAEQQLRAAQREADAYYVFSGGLSSGPSGWRSSILAPLARDALADLADGQLPGDVLRRVASLAEIYGASSMSDEQLISELRREFRLSNPREITVSRTVRTTPGGAWYGIIYQPKGGYRSPEVAKAILGPFKKKANIPTHLGQFRDGGFIRAVKLTSPMPNWMRKLPHFDTLVATVKKRR